MLGPRRPITTTEPIDQDTTGVLSIPPEVSIVATNAAQTIAGLTQAEKAEAREKRPETPTAAQRRARRDEYDMVVVDTETADAVRGLKGNDQEDAHEDRQERAQYSKNGSLAQGEARPQLDIEC